MRLVVLTLKFSHLKKVNIIYLSYEFVLQSSDYYLQNIWTPFYCKVSTTNVLKWYDRNSFKVSYNTDQETLSLHVIKLKNIGKYCAMYLSTKMFACIKLYTNKT